MGKNWKKKRKNLLQPIEISSFRFFRCRRREGSQALHGLFTKLKKSRKMFQKLGNNFLHFFGVEKSAERPETAPNRSGKEIGKRRTREKQMKSREKGKAAPFFVQNHKRPSRMFCLAIFNNFPVNFVR